MEQPGGCGTGKAARGPSGMDDLDLDAFGDCGGAGPETQATGEAALSQLLGSTPTPAAAAPRAAKRPRAAPRADGPVLDLLRESGGFEAEPRAQVRRPSTCPPSTAPAPLGTNGAPAPPQRTRRLPGPAGRLSLTARPPDHAPEQPAAPKRPRSAAGADELPSQRPRASAAVPPPLSAAPEAQRRFFSACGPWLAAAAALDLQPPARTAEAAASGLPSAARDWPPGVAMPPTPLAALLAAGRRSIARVPVVVALVAGVRSSDADVILALRDPTGHLTACATRRVIDEAGPALAAGAVLVLRGPAVFSPTPASRYLNILPANVAGIFPPWARVPPRRPPAAAGLSSGAQAALEG